MIKKFILITGASGGLGKALAYSYASRGRNILLVARREKILNNIAKDLQRKYAVEVHFMAVDLCDEGAAKMVFDWCKENRYGVEVLINNAGAGSFAKFTTSDIHLQMKTIDLNIKSLVQLTYYFLPELKMQKGTAVILNVASMAALYPLPNFSVYAASKAFVLSFTEAIRYEISGSDVLVSCLCPGDIDTDFFVNAAGRKLSRSAMTPEKLAEYVQKELEKEKKLIFPGAMKVTARIPRGILKRICVKLALREGIKQI